ncbi:PREDICTED: uncharacterized protein LOC104753517 [Camelina sativa]|uniref:Uncharacterized protein LOC104753517 n=1 Tax=Camelina sativa TaxID=90675 RepID=A0ABM0WP97_CAMSA|nr:PREDICTED: uncharacterized protein LOC104753517 [Camelina sativa]
MDAYLKVVRDLSQKFEFFELVKIPRSDNAPADALETLASTSDPDLRRIIPMESIDRPSINVNSLSLAPVTFPEVESSAHVPGGSNNVFAVPTEAPTTSPALVLPRPAQTPNTSADDDWQTEIIAYITDGINPKDKWEARRLFAKCAKYTMLDGNLFRHDANGALLVCINKKDVNDIMRKVHEGAEGNHSGGRALESKSVAMVISDQL